MLTVVGVIVFVVAILLSIALHEFGHFAPAKKFGVKITEYFVGFGPKLWSKKNGETEYGIKAIPFGGYVRMIGMFPPAADGTVRASSTGRLGMLIEQARQESAKELLTDDDRQRAFYALTVPRKLVVMFGGPLMNLIIAIVLFTVMFVGLGLPQPSMQVSGITPCLPSASNPTGECSAGQPASAASEAGLQPGDTIVAVGGQPVTEWNQFTDTLKTSPVDTDITVVRNGNELSLPVTLDVVERPVIVNGQDTGQVEQRPFLGVGPEFVLVPQSIASVPGHMWDLLVRSTTALISFPAKLVGVADAAFSDGQRDPEGPIGVVGATRISGEVAGAELPGTWKIAQLIGIIASVNLFLFLFNLIPLLPLDGGHIAGALYEGGRRQVAKARGKPDPGPVDVAKALPVAYAVASILIVVSVLLLYADIVSPVRIT